MSFALTDTRYTEPAAAGPPGFRPAGPAIDVRPARSGIARAQLIIEAEPPQLAPGADYSIRYQVFNGSSDPLMVSRVSVRNSFGSSSVTGGPVEPLARVAAPTKRTLLLETRGTWAWDPSTEWQTTLDVTLDDGSVYSATLRTRR